MFGSLTSLSLFCAFLNFNPVIFLIIGFFIAILGVIISQFEPAIVGYKWYDINKDVPFRIWNYLAFKGEKKRRYELCGILLPNPTTSNEEEKVLSEIARLSPQQKESIYNSLTSSKFQRVSDRANKFTARWFYKVWKWLFNGITAVTVFNSINNLYFNGDYKVFIEFLFSKHYLYLSVSC